MGFPGDASQELKAGLYHREGRMSTIILSDENPSILLGFLTSNEIIW